jgi:glycosyltransferase 2 family protein
MTWRGARARTIVGLAISAIALVLVVRSVDLAAAADALRTADPRWLILLVAAIAVDVLARAVRLQVLLAPVGGLRYRLALGALLIGYFANNVLPARLGELIRMQVVADRSGISRSTVLGNMVVERAVDAAVVVAIAALAIVALSVQGAVAVAVLVGLAVTVFLGLVVALAIMAHRLPGAERAAARLAQWPRTSAILGRLRDGLAVAGRPRTMVPAVALTVISWTCTVVAFAAAARAVGVEITLGQAALLAAGTNLATAVPAAPGYIGTFELAAVTIAASVGLPAGPALAFAVLVHVTILLLTSLGGVVAILAGGHRSAFRIEPQPGPHPDPAPEAAASREPTPGARTSAASAPGAAASVNAGATASGQPAPCPTARGAGGDGEPR